ncbi:hypothetical protein [Mahella australiensis]|uniref:Toprim domain-containing protein n=1 Tax=Mahella australiensis (strain DSM 15567 / CIP 107919 / 50-1 BON) TaxID=697281 RepID=F3ZXG4_MAHA5|nr:hypothetical protein [Mahella australiensis]AEE97645.1 toprim domain-containing protein [Mahella australiensis 50-1 BON]
MKVDRCYCPDCPDKEKCIHRDAYRRHPKSIGGLGLCPRLKDGTDPKREVPDYVITADTAN